jgi:uncharacterized protein YutE (UPF0331/DUF86 family)
MVSHAMLLSVQASVDIATGIAVMKTPRRPDTYRETFLVLGKFPVIPGDLAKEMSRLAGFFAICLSMSMHPLIFIGYIMSSRLT